MAEPAVDGGACPKGPLIEPKDVFDAIQRAHQQTGSGSVATGAAASFVTLAWEAFPEDEVPYAQLDTAGRLLVYLGHRREAVLQLVACCDEGVLAQQVARLKVALP